MSFAHPPFSCVDVTTIFGEMKPTILFMSARTRARVFVSAIAFEGGGMAQDKGSTMATYIFGSIDLPPIFW